MNEIGGRYRLGDLVGRGGMGQVFRGTDDRFDGRVVAIKRMNNVVGGQELKFDRLRREAILQANVRDKRHVVEVYDIVEHEGSLYVVMEFVEGGRSLSEMIGVMPAGAPGAPAIGQVNSLFLQACTGLQAVHREDLLHGDVKANNYLHTPEGVLKLTDFGLSRIAADEHASQICGTARNMAPELLRGRLTQTSDVYALGFTFYELYAGKEQFREAFRDVFAAESGVTAWAAWHADESRSAPPLSDLNPAVPKDVADGIARMIEKKVERRAGLEDMIEILGRHAAGEDGEVLIGEDGLDVTAPIDTLPLRPVERKRPGRTKLILAIVSVLTAVIAIFVVGLLLVLLYVLRPDESSAVRVLIDADFHQADGSGRRLFTNGREIRLKGRVDNAAGNVVTVSQGSSVRDFMIAEDGTFSGNFELDPAERAVMAITTEGLDEPMRFEIVRDTAPPVIALVEPAEGAALSATTADILVAVDEPHLRGVQLDDRELTPAGDGRWRAAGVALESEGENRFDIVARDMAGNSVTSTIAILRDTLGPELASVDPLRDEVVRADVETVIRLRFSEPVASAHLDSVELQIVEEGMAAFGALSVPSAEGAWEVAWRATDLAGNAGGDTLAWRVETSWASFPDAARDAFELVDPETVADGDRRFPRRIRHVATGVELVYVPGGSFQLGDRAAGLQLNLEWDPMTVRSVRITGFYAAVTEVTHAQWQRGGGTAGTAAGEDHPVVDVSWADAYAWCAGNGLQLPSEAQWEYLASGADDSLYPWGDDFVETLCNAKGAGTVAAGSFSGGASWCGATEVAGNVSEWCRDPWSRSYAALKPNAIDPVAATGSAGHVYRGGNYEDPAPALTHRTWYRRPAGPGSSFEFVGFRCALRP